MYMDKSPRLQLMSNSMRGGFPWEGSRRTKKKKQNQRTLVVQLEISNQTSPVSQGTHDGINLDDVIIKSDAEGGGTPSLQELVEVEALGPLSK